MGRLHALVLLAWALLRSLLAPLLGTRRGLAEFRRSYAPDRLPPLTPDERRDLPLLTGCIACGLCDVGEGARMARSGGAYAGVMDLMLASSRNMPDFDAAVRSFDAVGDDRLAELEGAARCRYPCERSRLSSGRRPSRPPRWSRRLRGKLRSERNVRNTPAHIGRTLRRLLRCYVTRSGNLPSVSSGFLALSRVTRCVARRLL